MEGEIGFQGVVDDGEEEANDDDKLRTEIWNARSVIDRGYLSLHTLLELQCTTSRGLMQNNVAQNIELLEGAFGVEKEKVEKVKDGAEAASMNVMNVTVAKRTLNEIVLTAVLTHPKGCQLLARAIRLGSCRTRSRSWFSRLLWRSA